jgi:drug/metabolite transporter (DMT)-like permease
MTRWAPELALVLTSLLWGATFVVVKNALDDISTVLFLALRFLAATVLLAALYLARGGRLRGAGGFGAGAVTGAMLYTGFLLQTLGLRSTTPATSGFITGLYIPIVPLLSAVVYARMPRAAEWAGIALATAGMGLLTLNPSTFAIGRGEMLTLACAVAFAVHILLLARFSRTMSTDWLTLQQIAVCALIGLGTFWWVEPVTVRWSRAVVLALVVTSALATALAFWLMTWAQARTSPTRAAVVFSMEPVFAWLTSWIVEGEVLTVRALAGAACILAGILLVELKPSPGARHPES